MVPTSVYGLLILTLCLPDYIITLTMPIHKWMSSVSRFPEHTV